MNMISSSDIEDRRQALADDVIADKVEALIQNYGALLRGELLEELNDLSASRRDEAVKQLYACFGASALQDTVVEITYAIRCQSEDLGIRMMETRKPRLLPAAE